MSNRSAAAHDLPVRLCMRADLGVSPQIQDGRKRWVLKDPIALQYFRISEQQYAVLQLLDGAHSLSEIRESLRQQFPRLAMTYSRLNALIIQLHRSGLAYSQSIGQDGTI